MRMPLSVSKLTIFMSALPLRLIMRIGLAQTGADGKIIRPLAPMRETQKGFFRSRNYQAFGAGASPSVNAWIEKYLSASVHTPAGIQPTPRASAPNDSTEYL